MHQICLGVCRKLFFCWYDKCLKIRLEYLDNLQKTSCYLAKNMLPYEIKRKPQSLSMAKYWKAVEWKHFLLYSGPVILKVVLPTDLYRHFILLSTAIYILSENTSTKEIDTAEQLSAVFHRELGNLYEENIYSINSYLLILHYLVPFLKSA